MARYAVLQEVEDVGISVLTWRKIRGEQREREIQEMTFSRAEPFLIRLLFENSVKQLTNDYVLVELILAFFDNFLYIHESLKLCPSKIGNFQVRLEFSFSRRSDGYVPNYSDIILPLYIHSSFQARTLYRIFVVDEAGQELPSICTIRASWCQLERVEF